MEGWAWEGNLSPKGSLPIGLPLPLQPLGHWQVPQALDGLSLDEPRDAESKEREALQADDDPGVEKACEVEKEVERDHEAEA